MVTQTLPSIFDVIVVGGGPAGLSSALVLGRSRRKVLVCDSGEPRNATSKALHSFLSRDGIKPSELRKIAREQIHAYDGVYFQESKVINVNKQESLFQIILDNGSSFLSRKLILAVGVIDELPDIQGMRELWGVSIFHCPYCHGWEVRDQSLALYGNGRIGFELSTLLTGWSCDLVLCTDGPAELSSEELGKLYSYGIEVRQERIAYLAHKNGELESIVFTDGKILPRKGIFLRPKTLYRTEIAKQLGCQLTDSGAVQVDEKGQTSVPGLYIAGDAAGRVHQAIGIVADGAAVAYGLNHTLIQEDLEENSRLSSLEKGFAQEVTIVTQ
jgi:thioredoxin reductase